MQRLLGSKDGYNVYVVNDENAPYCATTFAVVKNKKRIAKEYGIYSPEHKQEWIDFMVDIAKRKTGD